MSIVCIGIPIVDGVPAEAYGSQIVACAMIARSHEIVIPSVINVFPHARAREFICEIAREKNVDYLLFLDDDTIVPFGAFGELLRVMVETNAQMTVGHSYRRGYPFTPTWFKVVDGQKYVCTAGPKSGPQELDACGLACNLVNFRWVEKNVELPWFFKDRTCIWEDTAFCKKLKEAGGKIVGVPSVRCGHVGTRTVVDDQTQDQYRRWYIESRGKEPKSMEQNHECYM